MNYWLRLVLAAGSVAVLPGGAWAQTSGPRASPGLQQPQLRDDEQIMPSQIVKPPPAPPAKPKVAAKPKPAPAPATADTDTDDNPPATPAAPAKPKKLAAKPPAAADTDPDDPAAPAKPAPPPKPAEPARLVTCSGAFAKNSGHLRLAQAYGVHNVEFTEVAGDDGSTLMASVLFPADPKRRLEVLWDDDTQRAGTRMMVIDGQSTWTAYKGIHLGLPLAALEKVNGKPFKLMGFEKGGMAMVSDWNGGALGLLTDGCKVAVQLKPDPKAAAGTLEAAGSDKEFVSNDPAIKAAKPTIGEIIVGY
jgi:hypothetical protein